MQQQEQQQMTTISSLNMKSSHSCMQEQQQNVLFQSHTVISNGTLFLMYNKDYSTYVNHL
jgi:hypothetical protein